VGDKMKNIDFVKVQKLRLENNKSTTEMAYVLGISERAYRYKEKGEQPFKLVDVFKIIEAFGVKFEDLI
jgi:DNA-binding XRE family transcriptional regulator